jgi:transcriptional regulator GlxA family with amidase domain
MLKRLLLAGVPHNHSDLFNRAAPGPAPYYLRRVEEYIRHHAVEPISFSDLVEASGVSGRSLHFGFRRFRDDTPMGYLKKYRLDLAHKMLKIGIDEGRSVTEIAFACGFTHLSKFASSYLERFKERPSDTLKRLG